MTYRDNAAKQRLKAGEKILGCWINTGSEIVTELTANVGFDYLLIDQEHGVGDNLELIHQLQAARHTPATAIVRVAGKDPVMIKRALDAGAEGIMIPLVETAEEARQMVAACRFPSEGFRGAGWGGARCSLFALIPDYVEKATERLLIVIQVETRLAIENIDELVAVEGVDVIFIGPTDLSGSYGKLGNPFQPEMREGLARAEAKIRASGKALGTVPFKRTWVELFEAGYAMVNSASDTAMLRDRSLADVAEFRTRFRTG
ncbi:HpcH/HpaI aldolase family protein [Falsirhodobacter xinxiangensis]|uniref:HpcH/HpaI aldolase family protein n=1 Tax=Falsirhodobacter xinxiangensis TaxID=2530049 RepID=UPI00145B516A|nr:aldolase/citrate lyase family protein [Rhodobacter xinxiangensis]